MVIELKIQKIIFGGFGLGEYEGVKVFVPYTCPEEKLLVNIKEKKKHYWLGEIKEILEPSPFRIKPKCPIFTQCGSCDFLHIDYFYQLVLKKLIVSDTLQHLSKIFFPLKNPFPVLPFNYRNKVQMVIKKNKKISIGYYKKNTHEVIENPNCLINPTIFNEIRNSFRQFLEENNFEIYDERTQEGNLRFLVMRLGMKTDKILLIIVGKEYDKRIERFIDFLSPEIKNKITGFLYNLNPLPKNRILGSDFIVIWGNPFYFEELLNKKFRISANSFFQIHHQATEHLLKRAWELIAPEKNDTIFDLYSGVGIFSIILSPYVKEIVGVESEKNAYEDALFNKIINNCLNVNFILGKCEDVLSRLTKATKIIVDPPRKGLSPIVIKELVRISPPVILYVSCNPATFARDLKTFLTFNYDIETIELIDMFPQTYHVEILAKLVKK